MKKLAIVLMLLLAAVPSFAGGNGFLFKEKMPLESGSFRGKATLSLTNITLRQGQEFKLDTRFFNNSGGDRFFNPFFNRLIPVPATLAIFGSNKKYIGDLMANLNGSRRSINVNDDWVYIGSLAYVGKELSLTAGYVAGTKYDTKATPLPAGKYYLQLIYDKSFIGRGEHGELFRSNVIEIQILKPK